MSVKNIFMGNNWKTKSGYVLEVLRQIEKNIFGLLSRSSKTIKQHGSHRYYYYYTSLNENISLKNNGDVHVHISMCDSKCTWRHTSTSN